MAEAAKLCPYEQDYLSLLARRKQLKAAKIGRKWYTTVEWINDYLKDKKPEHIIPESNKEKKQARVEVAPLSNRFFTKPTIALLIALGFIILVSVAIAYNSIFSKVNELEKKAGESQFIPEEIIKIPDDSGNYEVYGVGRVRLGVEPTAE